MRGNPWCSNVLCRTPRYSTVLQGTPWCSVYFETLNVLRHTHEYTYVGLGTPTPSSHSIYLCNAWELRVLKGASCILRHLGDSVVRNVTHSNPWQTQHSQRFTELLELGALRDTPGNTCTLRNQCTPHPIVDSSLFRVLHILLCDPCASRVQGNHTVIRALHAQSPPDIFIFF